MTTISDLLDSTSLLHLVALIGVIVLVALGTVSVAVGFPIITGLAGLAIPTASSVTAAVKRITTLAVVPAPASKPAPVVPAPTPVAA